MRFAVWLLLPGLLLAACEERRQRASTQGAARPAARVVSATGASALPSASSTSESEGSLDLLHRTASVVVTSSHADGNSTGAYLVDELAETSWQPNPPDPAPWVELDLPAPASLERVELTLAPGSDVSSDAALEAARILIPGPDQGWVPLSARRSRAAEGTLLLEPETTAGLTRLRLSLSGAPRGLRVAEVRAIGGIASGEVLAPAIPETRVQGKPRLDYQGALFASWVRGAPYASSAALCRAFTRLLELGAESAERTAELCQELPQVEVVGAAPPEIRAVARYRLTIPDEVSPQETIALVVRGERGSYPANLALADGRNQATCPGGPEGDMRVNGFRFEQGVLLVERTRYFMPSILTASTPSATRPVAAVSVLACQLEGTFSCRELITQYGAPTILVDESGPPYRVQLPTSWAWSRTLTVSHRGSVRLTPCRAPAGNDGVSRRVACATPGVELL